MSKIGYFLAVKPEQAEEFVHDLASVAAFVAEAVEYQDDLGVDFLDVDKSWHGIHYLLTDAVADVGAPLAWVVFAPTLIGEDVGHGPARILMPHAVLEVSKALAPMTVEKLTRRCDWGVMNDRKIYPQGWRAGDEAYIAENFNSLKKLYESAARRRVAIVQWIS
jgi:hypothetical protein